MKEHKFVKLILANIKAFVRKLGYEIVPNGWYQRLSLNLSALNFLEHLIWETNQSLNCVYVVGCHNGDTINDYLNRFSPKEIIGFEPNPKLASVCSRRFNGYDRVSIQNLALGDKNGQTKLNIYDCDATSSILTATNLSLFNDPILLEEVIEVSIMRLDDYFGLAKKTEPIDLLHIDTQGADFLVLQGASQLLSNGKVKLIRVEVEFLSMYQEQHLAWDVMSWLNLQGFIFLGFVEIQSKKIDGVITPIWADGIFMHKSLKIN